MTVIYECLKRACQSKDIEFKEFLSTFPQHGVKVISHHDLMEAQREGVLANIENAAQYTSDFDSQLEIAHVFTLGVYHILTDRRQDFTQVDRSTNLKIITIDDLESWFSPPLSSPKKISLNYYLEKGKLNHLLPYTILFLATLISVTLLTLFFKPVSSYRINLISPQPYCPLDTNPFISCGEKIQIEESDSRFNFFNKSQKSAAQAFQTQRYENAVKNFSSAWEQYRSPETLIYLNNALLEKNEKKADTIAVTVPISRKITAISEEKDLAKEILRGVAQVQTLVNKCLLPDEFSFLPDSIKLDDSLCNQIKVRGKGLRVIIADDANNQEQAKSLAPELINLNNQSIIGVIGHSSSDLAHAVVGTYNENKLVIISQGSTSFKEGIDEEGKEYRFMKNDFFFRTAPNDVYTVEKLIEHLQKKPNLKKVVVFYNGDSIFSQPLAERFKEQFENEIGGEVLTIPKATGSNEDSTSFNGTNFNAQEAIANAQAKGADFFVMFPTGETDPSFENAIEIMKANQGQKPILGSWEMRNNRFLQAAKGHPEWLTNEKFVLFSFYDSAKTPNRQYVKNGIDLWGDASPLRTAAAYDAAWVLVNAILQTDNLTRSNLKETLDKIDEINPVKGGATGDIHFDKNGNRDSLCGLLLEVVEDKDSSTGLKFSPLAQSDQSNC